MDDVVLSNSVIFSALLTMLDVTLLTVSETIPTAAIPADAKSAAALVAFLPYSESLFSAAVFNPVTVSYAVSPIYSP